MTGETGDWYNISAKQVRGPYQMGWESRIVKSPKVPSLLKLDFLLAMPSMLIVKTKSLNVNAPELLVDAIPRGVCEGVKSCVKSLLMTQSHMYGSS